MGRGTTKNGRYATASKDPGQTKLKSKLKKFFGSTPKRVGNELRSDVILADIRANLAALDMTEEEVCPKKCPKK